MRKSIVLLLTVLALGCDFDLFDPFGTGSYDYDVWLPNAYGNSGSRQWPVLVFLHGAGGLPQNYIANFAEAADSFPFVLITPRTSNEWESDRLDNLLDEVLDKYRTDEDRVYVTGFSMGAHGTFDWAAESSGRIAAAIMIAGAGPSGAGCRIRAVPAWFIHNRNDPVVPTSETERTVAELTACSATPRVTINENPPLVGKHDAWTTAYVDPQLYTWLLGKSN